MVKLVELKDRNLFCESNYFKEHKEYSRYYELFLRNKVIEESDVSERDMKIIRRNKPFWINLCTEEWEADYKKPRAVHNKKDGHCDLCNQGGLLVKFKIKNMINGNEMFIGGTCADRFSVLREAKRIAKNSEQFERLEELRNTFEDTDMILINDESFIENQEILLSESLEESFFEIRKKILKSLNRYIKSSKSYDEEVLNEDFRQYNLIKTSIRCFVESHISDPHYMKKEHKQILGEKQHAESKNILQSIKRNEGIISNLTASSIKIPEYLSFRISEINSLIDNNDVLFRSAGYGKYKLVIKQFNEDYNFSIDSAVVFKDYLSKKDLSWDVFFLKYMEDFIPDDSDTKERLFFLGVDTLKRRLIPTKINVRALISNRKKDIQNYLGKVSLFKEEASSLNNTRIRVFTNQSIEKGAKILLVKKRPAKNIQGIIDTSTVIERERFIEFLLSNFKDKDEM